MSSGHRIRTSSSGATSTRALPSHTASHVFVPSNRAVSAFGLQTSALLLRLPDPVSPFRFRLNTAPASATAARSQLQRHSGSPSLGDNSNGWVKQLGKAATWRDVLLLLQKRPKSLSVSVVNPDALQALARCLEPGMDASAACGRLQDENLRELQGVVDDLLLGLQSDIPALSFPRAVGIVDSLLVLLPVLRGKLNALSVIIDLAERLQAAAATTNASPALSLNDLCHGFLSLDKLARLPSMQELFESAPEVYIVAKEFVEEGVLGGPDVDTRMEDADLATLTAATELVDAFDVLPSAAFVESLSRRVQVLVAEVEAEAMAEVEAEGRASWKPETASGKGVAAEKQSRGGGDRGRGQSGPSRKAPSSSAIEAGPPSLPGDVLLDAPGLASLVEAWCRCTSGRQQAPSMAWLARTAAAVFRSQDPATATRRYDLWEKLRKVGYQLSELRREYDVAKKRNQDVSAAAARDAGGRQGGRTAQGGAEDAAATADAADLGSGVEGVPPSGDGNVVDSAAAVVETAKASLAAAEKEFEAVRAALAEVAAAAPRLADEQLVSLLDALRGRLGEGAGEEVCRLAEAAVAARVDTMQPQLLVRALAALAHMGHFVDSFLQALQPHLTTLSSSDIVALLSTLQRLRYVPPLKGKLNRTDMLSVIAHAAGKSPPTELTLMLMPTCVAWGVAYPADMFKSLEAAVEQRVLRALARSQEGDVIGLLSAKAQDLANRYRINVDVEGCDLMRSQLLDSWVLPLVKMRHKIQQESLFFIALFDFMAPKNLDLNERLDEHTATLLLDAFVSNAVAQAWPLTPGQRQLLEKVVEAVLSQPPQDPGVRAPLLLAAARALRVIATKMSWSHDDPFVGSQPPDGRRPSTLLLPAIEDLMRLQPSAEHLAYVAQALFVELGWQKSPKTPKPHPGQQQPPLAWLTTFYRNLTAAVNRGDTSEVLGTLLHSLVEVEKTPAAATRLQDRGFKAARGALLQALAQALLRDPALPAFSAQPDALATAVRQLAVLGVRPPPGWLSQYVACVQGLLEPMSLSGLAYTAEGLALLHAAPPNVFIDSLLVQAGRRKVDTADPLLRGLLLGGVHALWQNGGQQERQEMSPLSKAAMQAWRLAQQKCTNDMGDAFSTFAPPQLVLVAAAVSAEGLSSSVKRTSMELIGDVEETWFKTYNTELLGSTRNTASYKAFLPPVSMLVDLFQIAARAQRGKGEILDYARKSIPKIGIAAASADLGDGAALSVREWEALLGAELSAGVRPSEPELTTYTSALIQSIAQRACIAASSLTPAASDTAEVDKLPVSTAVAQLQEVWSELEAALQGVLLPVLPWLPRADLLQALREGLLEQGPALLHASPRQLALLCTMCTQAGPGLATKDCWQRVGAELQRRLQLLLPPGQQDAAGTSGLQGDMATFAAMDLAAMCYGLDAAGCPLPVAAASWLRQLLRVSVASNSSGTGQVADPSAVWGSWHQLVGMVLPALQLLWAARCCGCLGEVPEEVWSTAYGGRDPWVTGMDRLQPRQLAQLVVLYRERAYGGSGGSGKGLPALPTWFVTAWMEPLGKAYEQELQGEGQQQGQGLLPPPHLGSDLAAWAVAYCTADGYQAPGSLVEAALPALAAQLPLEDVRVLLGVLHARSGWSLPQRHLEGLVARLLGPAAGGEGAQERQGRTPGGSASRIAEMPPTEALQFVQAILYVAPATVEAMATIDPLFTTLLPYAEEELCSMVAPERVSRAFLATVLAAPASYAIVVGAAFATAVEAILAHQQEQPLQYRPAFTSSGEVTSPLNISELPVQALVPLASALIACNGKGRLSLVTAAVLLRLLSVSGVVEGLSYSELDSAVQSKLVDSGLPMPDTTAAALDARLAVKRSTMPALDSVLRAAKLRRCGASAVLSQCALLALRDAPSEMHKWSHRELRPLREMLACGARERLAICDRPPLDNDTFNAYTFYTLPLPSGMAASTGGASGPFAEVTGLLFGWFTQKVYPAGHVFVTWPLPVSALFPQIARQTISFEDAAEALQLVSALHGRLDGLECLDFNHRLSHLLNCMEMLCSTQALAAVATANPNALWQFLEAANEFGCKRYNDLIMEAMRMHRTIYTIRFGEERLMRWTPEEDAIMSDVRGEIVQQLLERGSSYLIRAGFAQRLAAAVQPLLSAHAQALQGQLGKQQNQAHSPMRQAGQAHPLDRQARLVTAVAGAMDAGKPREPALVSSAPSDAGQGNASVAYHKSPLDSPRLLTARQLGLLYGLLALQQPSPSASSDLLDGVLIEARKVAPLYHDMLHRLAARTDLPPLEHLTAVLDALEPVVVYPLGGQLVDPKFYEEEVKIEELLLPVVTRVMQMDDEPLPRGVDPLDDVYLVTSPYTVDEESLMEGLYLEVVQQQVHTAASPRARLIEDDLPLRRLALPQSLWPPPGRRHGQPGDPAGDAAREAYVRAAAPWVMAARRVQQVLHITCRFEAMIQKLGKIVSGRSRWARMMISAVAMTNEARQLVGTNSHDAMGMADPSQHDHLAAAKAAAADLKAMLLSGANYLRMHLKAAAAAHRMEHLAPQEGDSSGSEMTTAAPNTTFAASDVAANVYPASQPPVPIQPPPAPPTPEAPSQGAGQASSSSVASDSSSWQGGAFDGLESALPGNDIVGGAALSLGVGEWGEDSLTGPEAEMVLGIVPRKHSPQLPVACNQGLEADPSAQLGSGLIAAQELAADTDAGAELDEASQAGMELPRAPELQVQAQQQQLIRQGQSQAIQEYARLGLGQSQTAQEQAGLGVGKSQAVQEQAGIGMGQSQAAQEQAGLGVGKSQADQEREGLGLGQSQAEQEQAGQEQAGQWQSQGIELMPAVMLAFSLGASLGAALGAGGAMSAFLNVVASGGRCSEEGKSESKDLSA